MFQKSQQELSLNPPVYGCQTAGLAIANERVTVRKGVL